MNVSGSFVIGLFALQVAPGGVPAERMAAGFVMTALRGGYSLQTLNLARDSEWPRAFANIVASAALCLLAVWAGFALGAFTPGG